MTTCRAIVKVEDEFKDRVEDAIKEAYPRSSLVSLDHAEDAIYATFRIDTRETCNAVDAHLHGMDGISVLSVSRSHAGLPPRLRTGSFWTVAAMSVAWAVFVIVGASPNSLVNEWTQAQMLVIQMTFTLAVAIVVYMHDRDAIGYLSDRVNRIHFLAGEINGRVRGMEGGRH